MICLCKKCDFRLKESSYCWNYIRNPSELAKRVVANSRNMQVIFFARNVDNTYYTYYKNQTQNTSKKGNLLEPLKTKQKTDWLGPKRLSKLHIKHGHPKQIKHSCPKKQKYYLLFSDWLCPKLLQHVWEWLGGSSEGTPKDKNKVRLKIYV